MEIKLAIQICRPICGNSHLTSPPDIEATSAIACRDRNSLHPLLTLTDNPRPAVNEMSEYLGGA